jgi:hypothetical protein
MTNATWVAHAEGLQFGGIALFFGHRSDEAPALVTHSSPIERPRSARGHNRLRAVQRAMHFENIFLISF